MITVHDLRTGPAALAERHGLGLAVLHAAATLARRVAWWWLQKEKGAALKGPTILNMDQILNMDHAS